MKRSTFLKLKLREATFISRALLSTRHPVLAHVIPMRRCNLDCTYCNEYDKVSEPVPLDVMKQRLDKLADLGTSIITISGGEPMMHPGIYEIVRHIRRRGMLAGLITNGYYLTPAKIKKFNEAGLEYLQISIDNVEPDEVSKKSLSLLDKRLRWLSEHADFQVNINSVIGSGVNKPEDALVIDKRALELGFTSTIGVIHDGSGELKPLGDNERRVYREVQKLPDHHEFEPIEIKSAWQGLWQLARNVGRREYARLDWFQEKLIAGKPNEWRCRAGARYLYVSEDGLVHYCSQQRGLPGIPLEDYTMEDFEREYNTEKWCAPFCTVACVHKVSVLDNWRDPQIGTQNARPQKLRDAIGRVLRAE
ncbi:MAG: radical SAM protein [Acidobacteria bacterium]|nr:radical SAM protein [Acidobacteriota bacterium]